MFASIGRSWRLAVVSAIVAGLGQVIAAQAPAPAQTPAGQQPAPAEPPVTFTVAVIGTTPLPGVELPAGRVPSPVQTATDRDIDNSGALDVSDFLNRRMNGVHVNEVQNNPFQPDVNYRGYTASPLLGTPQGLSVYMDGVRLNQPFGEVVSWDLIPRIAVASTTLMPGSNPMFGLNTLGGALSLQTKDGRTHPGTTVQATYGSDVRRALEFEHGGQSAGKAIPLVPRGQRCSPKMAGATTRRPTCGRSSARSAGSATAATSAVSVGHADNSLTGNGLQEFRLLDRRLREHLHEAGHDRQPLDAAQRRRRGAS